MKNIIFIAFFIIIMALPIGAQTEPRRFVETRLVMNAPMQIIIYAPAPPSWDGIFSRAEQIAVLYDHRLDMSPVAEINRTGRADVPPPVFDILARALTLAEKSDGAYDPTVLNLMRLWNFQGGGRVPSREEIADALEKTGYRHVRMIKPGTVILENQVTIDIGGIGEGAVVDATADFLDASGYTSYLIDAAGEIVVRGVKPGGKPWTVAIRSPRKPGLDRTDPKFKQAPRGLLGALEFSPTLGRIAVSTSGDYEKFFVSGGKAYHHILDPRTGYPARSVASVTVISPSCAEADSLATAAFVLGFDQGADFLEQWPGALGLLVREKNGKLELKATSGFPELTAVDN